MNKHSNYSVVDLLLDDSFVEWVKRGCPDEEPWAGWRNGHPDKEDEFLQARDIVLTATIIPSKDLSPEEIRHLSNCINQKISERELSEPLKAKTVLLWRSPFLRAAALVFLFLSAGLLFFYVYTTNGSSARRSAQISSDTRTIDQPGLVRLPDGTSVVLKSGSSIQFKLPFLAMRREVHLRGEAYFEVAKDKRRPFFVYSDEMVVKVLGTSFLVKAYHNDKKFNVMVTSGKVSVFNHKDAKAELDLSSLDDAKGKGVLLKPQEEVSYDRRQEKMVKTDVKEPSILSEDIAKRELNFVETPFSEVVSTLSNAYDIPILYDNSRLGKCPLTASLSDQPFYEKLALLCKAVEATYEVREGRIVISGKGCKEDETN